MSKFRELRIRVTCKILNWLLNPLDIWFNANSFIENKPQPNPVQEKQE